MDRVPQYKMFKTISHFIDVELPFFSNILLENCLGSNFIPLCRGIFCVTGTRETEFVHKGPFHEIG
jgi:hypothetical protein